MKKTLRKRIAVMMSALMLTSLVAGCTDGAGTTTTTTTAATTAGTTASGATTTAADVTTAEVSAIEISAEDGMAGWTAFDNNVTITVPVYDRSKEGYPAVDNNYWTQYIQKEFGDAYNITVQYVAIPRTDVMTKYNLLILGGETPTIMMEYDYPKVAQWANDGAMAPLDLEAFAKVAPTYYGKMVENNQLGYTDINGESFFALTERPYFNTNYTYQNFFRKDWLDQLGLAIPTNYAEYSAALKAVKEAGISEFPFGLGLPSSAYVANFGYHDYPLVESEWAQHASLGTASLTWKPTERLLRRQNQQYNDGLISPEYDLDVQDVGGASQMQTDFINGKLLNFGGYLGANMEFLTAFYQNNPDAELVCASYDNMMVEPGVVETPGFRADNPFGMIVGFSALATPEQLQAAWMLMEWMIQPENLFVLENGVEGVTYTIGEDGLPVVDGDYRGTEMLNHNMNIDMTCLVHAAKKLGTVEQSIGAQSPKGLPKDFTAEIIANYDNLVKIAEANRAVSDPVFAVTIEAETEYAPALLSLYKEYSVMLTKCKPEEFDALYADLSQRYLDAGYQSVIDERLAAYNAGNTTKLPY